MGRIVCFGEIMLRLSPPGYLRFCQAKSFDVIYGGSEANVAVSLSDFGHDAAFVTRLPDNLIGQACRNELRAYGVDTDAIVWGGDRLGIYFCERGASMRASQVIYDRAGASIATVAPGAFDWERIFAAADWFHFSGITPALGQNVAAVTMEALQAARKLGLTVSCDLNYRSKLWGAEEAGLVLGEMLSYVDVFIANEEHAKLLFGIEPDPACVATDGLSGEGYRQVARRLTERFGLKLTAITLRKSLSANDTGWAAMMYDGREYYQSRQYQIHIIDRVGGGDSFGAGLIHGMLSGMPMDRTLEFAAAASALKQTIEGDANHVLAAEVLALMEGDGSGRIQR